MLLNSFIKFLKYISNVFANSKQLNQFNLRGSWPRLVAVVNKEFIQMRRDRLNLAMIIGIPLMQLILFGYAINTNPKHLPTVVVAYDYSDFTRTFIAGLKNSSYFTVTQVVKSEAAAQKMLEMSAVQFIINIPADFTRKIVRGLRPQVLIQADATDSVATGSATNAVMGMAQSVFQSRLPGNLRRTQTTSPPVDVVVHPNYNPESITSYNIVPGLLGVILTMTMVMVTSMGITREREKGTMEHLLATPVRPLEVMLGKIAPYIIVGYAQMFLILVSAQFVFLVPMQGRAILLVLCALPFIAANLAVGLTFSSLARNQLQAAQMSTFFFLPSMLLSGFMFPFKGMPLWAQGIGHLLPLTYFLRITRGIVLKGNDFGRVWPDLWPIMIFMVVAMVIGLKRYRKTLD